MKIVHEDDQSIRMDNGRVLAKRGLSPGYIAQIKKQYADGGDITQSPQPIKPDATTTYTPTDRGTVKVESDEPDTYEPVKTPRTAAMRSPPPRRMADGGTVDAGGQDAGPQTTIAPDGTVTIQHAPSSSRLSPDALARMNDPNNPYASGAEPVQQWPASGQSPMSGAGAGTPALPYQTAKKVVAADNPLPPVPSLKPAGTPAAPATAAQAPKPTGGGAPANDPGQDYLTASFQTGEQAAAEKANALSEQARNEQAAYAANETRLVRQQQETQAVQAKAAADTQDAMSKYRQAMDGINSLDTSIDPNRYWNNKSMGSKVAAIAGVFLSGIPGGHNQALDALQKAKEDDLNAQLQEHDLAFKKGQLGAEQAKSIVGMTHQIFQDRIASMAAADASANELFANQMKQYAAVAADPIAKSELNQTISALQKQHGDELNAAAQRHFTNGIEQQKLDLLKFKGNPAAQEAEADEAAKQTIHEAVEALGERPVGEVPIFGPLGGPTVDLRSPEAARKLDAMAATVVGGGQGARINDEQKRAWLKRVGGLWETPQTWASRDKRKQMKDEIYKEYLRNKATSPKTKLGYNDLPGGEGG